MTGLGLERKELIAICGFIAAIWVVFFIDRFLPLEVLGLRPRSLLGIPGIIAMPFLHQDFTHLLSNTLPLLVLLTFVAITNRAIVIAILVSLLGGVLLWIFGRSANHIGASGLVFGLATYLMVMGVYARTVMTFLAAVATAILYGGSLLIGVLPLQAGVSWDGHLLGALAGALLAFTQFRYR